MDPNFQTPTFPVDANQNVLHPPSAPFNPDQFNPTDKKYKAFCCFCHVTKLTWIGGIDSLIKIIIWSILNMALYALFGTAFKGIFWTMAVFFTLVFVSIILLFYSIRSQNPWHVLPHTVYSGIALGFFFVGGVFSTAVLASGGGLFLGFCWKFLFKIYPELKVIPFLNKIVMYGIRADEDTKVALGVVKAKIVTGATAFLIGAIISVFINAFFLYVEVKCFRYFKDKQRFAKSVAAQDMAMAATNPVPVMFASHQAPVIVSQPVAC